MLTCDYIVIRIDGDYAGLYKLPESAGAGDAMPTAPAEAELNFVARALLPEHITEGCRIHYEMLTYTLVGEV